jgi:hypothetical protein
MTASLITPHQRPLRSTLSCFETDCSIPKHSACDLRGHPPFCIPGTAQHIPAPAIVPPLKTPPQPAPDELTIMKMHGSCDPSPSGYKASKLRLSSSQPFSAESEPAQHTAFAAPGASLGVLGTKGGVAGHCSQKGQPFRGTVNQFFSKSAVRKTVTCLSQQLSMIDDHWGSVLLGISSLWSMKPTAPITCHTGITKLEISYVLIYLCKQENGFLKLQW